MVEPACKPFNDPRRPERSRIMQPLTYPVVIEEAGPADFVVRGLPSG
jgi:hypothetical protein